MESWTSLHFPSSINQLTTSTSPFHTLLTFSLLLFLSWLLLNLLYWSFPGGPAWGKHHLINRSISTPRSPIPGPRGLPFLGSMHLMTGLAHRRLARTASNLHAERLMAFSLGETRVIITGNHQIAKEILNSHAFTDRPLKELAHNLLFHRAIGFAPYGLYWRTLRRIAATHLFSPSQIGSTMHHRYAVAEEMVSALRDKLGEPVLLRDILKHASLSHMMLVLFGRRYRMGWEMNPELKLLRSLVDEGYDLLGKLDLADHIPFLSMFDLQKIRFRSSNLVPKVTHFVSRFMQEQQDAGDFLHVLLSLEGSERLSHEDMVAVLWEMIFRGTDTVAVLMEWVIARMVMHQEVQDRVQQELDRVVGTDRAVSEADVAELGYLQAVLKEVLRLHPPGPLLSWARRANCDATVDGRHVPVGTTAMVNMWAITHDEAVWEGAHEFRPGRFAGKGWEGFSVMGSDLRLAPFGAGRRSCPGKVMGMATVGLWVATLLREYTWRVGGGHGAVDLSEVLRLSCEMATPLTVEVALRRPR